MDNAGKPKFVYVTYISTTPDKLWNALVKTEITQQYWGGHHNVSDWKPGSSWKHQDSGNPALVDLIGKVVESVPPRRLVLTWAPANQADQSKHSRVTFEIEPFKGVVRLTVTHDEFEPGAPMFERISAGWPAVLSSLKTFLETGTPLAMTAQRDALTDSINRNLRQ